jgi:hypothetical protein
MRSFVFAILAFSLLGCSSINLKRKTDPAFNTLFFGTVIEKEESDLDVNKDAATRFTTRMFAGGSRNALGQPDRRFEEPSGYIYTIEARNGSIRKILSPSSAKLGSCVEVISIDDTEIEILHVVLDKKCSD